MTNSYTLSETARTSHSAQCLPPERPLPAAAGCNTSCRQQVAAMPLTMKISRSPRLLCALYTREAGHKHMITLAQRTSKTRAHKHVGAPTIQQSACRRMHPPRLPRHRRCGITGTTVHFRGCLTSPTDSAQRTSWPGHTTRIDVNTGASPGTSQGRIPAVAMASRMHASSGWCRPVPNQDACPARPALPGSSSSSAAAAAARRCRAPTLPGL